MAALYAPSQSVTTERVMSAFHSGMAIPNAENMRFGGLPPRRMEWFTYAWALLFPILSDQATRTLLAQRQPWGGVMIVAQYSCLCVKWNRNGTEREGEEKLWVIDACV